MRVPLPNLDDVRWADLIEDGRSLIPLYGGEWTDHNVHDPGITIIELMAWIAEMDIYQLNRVPDRHKLKFLSLVGIQPEPPRPSGVVLSLELISGASILLPASAEFTGLDTFEVPTGFRTLKEVNIVPGTLAVLLVSDSSEISDHSNRLQTQEDIAILGSIPKPGNAAYFGFTSAFPAGESVTLHFTFSGGRSGSDEAARISKEAVERWEDCQPPESPCIPGGQSEPSTSHQDEWTCHRAHHSVRLAWEALVDEGGAKTWAGLEILEDTTRALTLDGNVTFRAPAGMTLPETGSELPVTLYFIRVRFQSGEYDAPPLLATLVLNGVEAEQTITLGEVIDVNGELVRGLLAAESSGDPNQRLLLETAPVLAPSFRLFTSDTAAGTFYEWERRTDFDASNGPHRHFLLDPGLGLVTFGDGKSGRVPANGDGIYVSYLWTRAEDGNIGARSITTLAPSPHNLSLLSDFQDVEARLGVTNPLPASGGAAQESVEAASARAAEMLFASGRAVTLSDYEMLALATPGTRVARAKAIANYHPGFPCLAAQGIVTVIILPAMPVKAPMPSDGLKGMVHRYLDRRRIIGTRVMVVGPEYLDVSVSGKVRALPGIDRSALTKRITEALARFFDPFAGGPSATGWPFGRDVYRSEVLQVIDEVPGVDHVISLELRSGACKPQCGNLCVTPTSLVTLKEVTIEVN